MKSLTLLILSLCLLNYIKSSCVIESDNYDSPEYRDGEDCSSRVFSEEELDNNAYKCCLLKYESETANLEEYGYTCIPITEDNYNNIDDYIDYLEDQYDKVQKIDFSVEKLDCKSNYLKSFLILSLLLFL